MLQFKFRIKSAAGSLAWRVVIVSLCLLVLPLLLNTLFIYRADFEDNVDAANAVLKLTAAAQKELLDQRISLEWKILDSVSLGHIPSGSYKDLGVEEFPTPINVRPYFVMLNQEQGVFLAGKKIDEKLSLVIPTNLNYLFRILKGFEEEAFPTSLAFVNENGEVLVGAKQETPFYIQLPIEAADFFLYLSIPSGVVEELSKKVYLFHFLSLFCFIALIGGGIVGLVTRRIAKPFNTLCETMKKVSEGAVHARYAPDKMGFEINVLGNQFNETLDQLLQQQNLAEKERIGREKLAQELKIGHEIQINLLPRHLHSFAGVDLAAGFVSAREVGGDFYDIFPLDDGSIMIVIADTAGKGISACLYALGLRSIIRTLAATKKSLSEIVIEANRLFWQDAHESNMFVTLWIGIYDPIKRSLEYSCNGHPPVIAVIENQIQELTTPGIPIGIEVINSVEIKKITFSPHSLLFLYTDGVIEAHNKNDELFGISRLKKFLQNQKAKKAEEIHDLLLEEIQVFSKDTLQHDDMTFVVLKIT